VIKWHKHEVGQSLLFDLPKGFLEKEPTRDGHLTLWLLWVWRDPGLASDNPLLTNAPTNDAEADRIAIEYIETHFPLWWMTQQ
jgi:hypothetical protein